MKIAVAMDSFKGSMTSLQAGEAARAGILRACPDAQVSVRPVADGGEGTVAALVEGMHGVLRTVRVTGPLGAPVDAAYGIVGEDTAVVELAAAAGLALVPEGAADPMRTTTYGVGEMIADAIRSGCRNVLLGIGGSATNDGGVGMLQALGFSFLDAEGKPVPPGAAGVGVIASIEDRNVSDEVRHCRFRVACDVKNPLCGPNGCSAVFAPQKGARTEDIPRMDAWLARYAQLVRLRYPSCDPDMPGAGAAGGVGFACSAVLGAELTSGIRLVLELAGVEETVRDADLVITGEGRTDAQTAMGKAPAGIAALAKRYGKPVLVLSGSLSGDIAACHACGIDALFPILRAPCTLQQAMEPDTARANMTACAEQVMRLWQAAGR